MTERKFWYESVEKGELVLFVGVDDVREQDHDTKLTDCVSTLFIQGLPISLEGNYANDYDDVIIQTCEELETYLDEHFAEWDVRAICIVEKIA